MFVSLDGDQPGLALIVADTPMSYLYGIRFVGKISPIVLALRQVRRIPLATLMQ